MSILFLGNDRRQSYACKYLIAKNIPAEHREDSKINDTLSSIIASAEIISLPVPTSKDGIHINGTDIEISDIGKIIREGCTIFGSNIGRELADIFAERRIIYYDYNEITDFQIKNALLSAEGAIHLAKSYYERSIYGSKIAVIGYGRIGKILSFLLRAQSSSVCIFARSANDISWSSVLGFEVVRLDESILTDHFANLKKEYDIIFNTVPHNVISENVIKHISTETLVIDLASSPYGIDLDLCKKYALNYHIESGIPGRYAPASAGALIGETILNIIKTKGEI